MESKNESVNITGGEFATILKNGSITNPATFDENEIKEKTGFAIDTLWNAKEIEVKDYIICKKLDENGKPVKATTNFSTEDRVYAWLDLLNASEGDRIKWVFEGPNNITKEVNYTVNWSDNGYCYAWLYLDYGNKGIGQWKVTAYINGEKARIAYFNVKAPKASTPGFGIALLVAAFLFIFGRRNRRN